MHQLLRKIRQTTCLLGAVKPISKFWTPISPKTVIFAVVEFFRTQMHCRVDADNIDTDHLVKPKVVSVPDGDQRRSRNGVLEPTVLVCFHSRTMRGSIIRERKILKGSKYAVSEDLTTLNVSKPSIV